MSEQPPEDAGSPPPQDAPYPPGPQDRPYPPAPPTYGYGYAPEHPQGTTVLILGICSLVVCQLLGPVAWWMGNSALREIDANPYAFSNRSTVQAGRVCGVVATALTAVGAVIVVGAALILVASSTTG
jgi:hypothetical protein